MTLQFGISSILYLADRKMDLDSWKRYPIACCCCYVERERLGGLISFLLLSRWRPPLLEIVFLSFVRLSVFKSILSIHIPRGRDTVQHSWDLEATDSTNVSKFADSYSVKRRQLIFFLTPSQPGAQRCGCSASIILQGMDALLQAP